MVAQVNYNPEEPSENKTNKWHKKEGPHEEFFGNLYGVTIWNIIRGALFPNEWWGFLISAILGIGLVVGFVKYLENHKAILKYHYKVKGDDLVGILIGLVVVSVLYTFLFNQAWWAEIMVASVSITFVKTLYELIMKEVAKTQAKPEPEMNQMQSPQIVQAAIQPIQTNLTCPNCGFERSEQSKFCIGCGYKF